MNRFVLLDNKWHTLTESEVICNSDEQNNEQNDLRNNPHINENLKWQNIKKLFSGSEMEC